MRICVAPSWTGGWPPARIDAIVGRILYAMLRHGLVDHPATVAPFDLPADMLARNTAVSRADAAEAIVLLKSGGHADKGVLAGGGSSLVYSKGGNAVPGLQPAYWPGPLMYHPSSPLEALRRRSTGRRRHRVRDAMGGRGARRVADAGR